MKQNGGFTLVELLAVIALLGIIATIAVTSAINISKDLKEDMFCQQVDFISTAAKTYGQDIFDGLTESGVTIKVSELIKKGYLKKDQVNLKDDSSLENVDVRVYRKNNRAYAHVNIETSSCE